MNEQMMLRFAMILQNQAPSTLNKYICKLSEMVLLDRYEQISAYELSQLIYSHFDLLFTEEEIIKAIAKKGKSRICIVENTYSLYESARKSLLSQQSLSQSLDNIIERFLEGSTISVELAYAKDLILRYLYYCFNSNVNNLLSLLQKSSPDTGKTAFEGTADDIDLINSFITWENPEKDSLIYSMVATCYEYCMLTIKKDTLLSIKLFQGKKFYLDSNIIFRLSGINNKERQIVIENFIYQCKRVGIQLCCTHATIDEIYRVVSSQIKYIRSISGDSMPVSSDKLRILDPNIQPNDFYELYYKWCHTPGNSVGDYIAFQRHLLQSVQKVLVQFGDKASSDYKVGTKSQEYDNQSSNLHIYKNSKRPWRPSSRASAETDITNLMDVQKWRKQSGHNLWQTNEFLVSADQLLISWANNMYNGIPLVVLPSVWLSIILRFSGRTDDDYRAFCLFLTQRQHQIDSMAIDPALLLRCLNRKTTQVVLKEQIIVEIANNKSEYTFEKEEDYDANVDLAFDRILKNEQGKTEEQIALIREESAQMVDNTKRDSEKLVKQAMEVTAEAEREKTISTLANQKAERKVRPFRSIQSFYFLIYILGGLIFLVTLVVMIWQIYPFYTWIYNTIPESIRSWERIIGVWTLVSFGMGLFLTGLGKFITYLGSEKRKGKLYQRYYKRNKKELKNSDTQ